MADGMPYPTEIALFGGTKDAGPEDYAVWDWSIRISAFRILERRTLAM